MCGASSALAVTSKVIGLLNPKAESCPHCDANLVAGEIPQDSRHCYISPGQPDDGRRLFYSRAIGIYDFDYTLAYQCPDCKVIDVRPGFEDLWARSQREQLVDYAHEVLGLEANHAA